MNQYDKMIKTSIPKLITKLSIPSIISMLVTAIYNMADVFFVTQSGGNSPSAAISVVFSLQTLIQATGFSIGMGCGALVSRCLGKNDIEKANNYLNSSLVLGIFIGLIICIFGSIYNEDIMRLLGASVTSLPYAVSYSKWIFIVSPFMISAFIMNASIRNEGKAYLSMIGIGIGSLINIGLDPLFIYVFNMGISGAGLATMISQFISFFLLLSFYLFKVTTTKLNPKYISSNPLIYLEAFKCGIPTLFRQGCSTAANITLSNLGKPYGDVVVSALGITAKIYTVIRSFVIGVGQGYQPVLGYSYGAKKYKRIKEAFYFTLALQTGICLLGTILTLSIPGLLMNAFTSDSDAIKIGEYSIRFIAIGLPLLGFSTIVNQSLQVTGYSFSASFLASLRQGIIYVPLMFLLNGLLHEKGLALTQPLSDLLTALISIPFLFYFFNILGKKAKMDKENTLLNKTV